MVIQLNRPEDQTVIKDLFSEIYQDFKAKNQEAFFNWPESQIEQLGPTYRFLLLWDSTAQLNGMICFQEIAQDYEIIALGVKPKQQGRGYMNMLFRFFVENICKHESTVFLEVHEKNRRALQFYKKAGFQIDGFRKNYYSDGGSAINMSMVVVKKSN